MMTIDDDNQFVKSTHFSISYGGRFDPLSMVQISNQKIASTPRSGIDYTSVDSNE